MPIAYGSPNLKPIQDKLEEIQSKSTKKAWYEKWWGILILGIIGSAIVGVVFYFLQK